MAMPARSVLLVKPVGFRPDPETALDNTFQAPLREEDADAVQIRAFVEFDGVVSALQSHGVAVTTFDGSELDPDAVFPNNWFSTFADGSLVLYPMKAISRRGERRDEIVNWLLMHYPQLVDMTSMEERDMFLEGTGSLVLDRENQIAFAGISERTNEQLVKNWCGDFEYEPVIFETSGPSGAPIYHTNVLLSICSKFVVVCSDAIKAFPHVLSALLAGNREVIEITWTQMSSFCANVLELEGTEPILMMSRTAHDAFSQAQLEKIQSFVKPVVVDIPTIEKYGGGGIRCMIAELF